MNKRLFLRIGAKFLLVSVLLSSGLPSSIKAQTSSVHSATNADYTAQIAEIEAKFEKRRKELNVVGASFAVVKDGKILLSKGFGYKNLTAKTPVTADTLFAIGSSSKAFTALSVLMSAERGKLSLEDSPKKFLPYFKMNDAEADAKITVRDLMRHSSGVMRTDLPWITGVLSREEAIRVIADAKPTAKLGEQFQYQNIMFAAAGEVVAKTSGKSWETFVKDEIFRPLEMNNSNLFVPQTLKSKDFSEGYQYNSDTKETRRLPMREFPAIAPAGAINSSANDMAKWLLFLTNKGELNGKRLINAQSFQEWTKPQMKVSGSSSYALGWFLKENKGIKIIEHGGNIDGFSAQVAFYPEQNLGFVVLANADKTSLGTEMMNVVQSVFLNKNSESPKTNGNFDRLLGKYNFAEAGFDVEVKMIEGVPYLSVPGQPDYKLVATENSQRFRFENAPDGFFATFKPSEGNVSEIYLEQPQGNYTLKKITVAKEATTTTSVEAKELAGKFQFAENPLMRVEVKDEASGVTLNIPGQQPYVLILRAKDEFALKPLPETYFVRVVRDANGRATSLKIIQPEGETLLNRVEETGKIDLTVEDLMKKVIEVSGGEANLRKMTSRVTKSNKIFVNQGVRSEDIVYEVAPNKVFSSSKLYAVGKKIGEMQDLFDGANSVSATDFSEPEIATGKALADARKSADFYATLNWKSLYKNVQIVDVVKVKNEEAYVVEMKPEQGNSLRTYISKKTFLPIRQDSLIMISPEIGLPSVTYLEDYRNVDGVLLPFRIRTENFQGETVSTVTEVKHNVKIDDKIFRITVKRR